MTAARDHFRVDTDVQRLGPDLAGTEPAETLAPPEHADQIRALLRLTTHPIEPLDYAGAHREHILAPFLRPQTSRFSDGSYGVLYAALAFETALAEVAYWAQRIFSESNTPAGARMRKQHLTFRAKSDAFADIRVAHGIDPAIYDPDDYTASQRLGHTIRDESFWGVYYDSVRRTGTQCIGAFVPRVASHVRLRTLIEFTWDGARVSHWGTVNPL